MTPQDDKAFEEFCEKESFNDYEKSIAMQGWNAHAEQGESVRSTVSIGKLLGMSPIGSTAFHNYQQKGKKMNEKLKGFNEWRNKQGALLLDRLALHEISMDTFIEKVCESIIENQRVAAPSPAAQPKEEQMNELVEALRDIIKHQKIIAPNMHTIIESIAMRAVEKYEKDRATARERNR